MWFGSMLNGLSLLVGKVIETYGTCCDPWVSFSSKIIMGIGLAAFQANIVQLGIDQLIDASSDEIQTVIVWYVMAVFTSGITVYYSSYCTQEYVAVVVIALLMTMSICSDMLVNHWLSKEQIVDNPLPLILKVVYYTIKRKFKHVYNNNSVQQGSLSIFNVAKRVYNGPFSSEQVEDVKTFFRVLVVVVIFTVFSSGSSTVNDMSNQLATNLQNWPLGDMTRECYHEMSINYAAFTYSAITVLIYMSVVHPLFHTCIPRVSITIKFLFSVLMFFAAVLTLLGIESISYIFERKLNESQNITLNNCVYDTRTDYAYSENVIDAHWIILANVLNGLSIFVYVLSGIEFICAQAPFNMKGLVIGIGYALFGLCALVHLSISDAFTKKYALWKNAPLTCGIWFFMMEGIIILTGFFTLVVIVKMYKRRVRIGASSHNYNDSHDSDTY